jgi:hypothetical protein
MQNSFYLPPLALSMHPLSLLKNWATQNLKVAVLARKHLKYLFVTYNSLYYVIKTSIKRLKRLTENVYTITKCFDAQKKTINFA